MRIFGVIAIGDDRLLLRNRPLDLFFDNVLIFFTGVLATFCREQVAIDGWGAGAVVPSNVV